MKKKKLELYDKNGYLNISEIVKHFPQPFIFITGGRGIGKSYGAYKYMLESGSTFFSLRRTETEAEIMSNPITSQVASVARDIGKDLDFGKMQNLGTATDENGEVRSFFGSLMTLKNFRGIDLSACTWLIYDEFVPEIHTRKIKEEGLAFGNVYETINRNRELNGEPPLRCLFLSNSFNLASDIYRFFGLIDHAEELQAQGGGIWEDSSKVLIMPNDSPISERKQTTAIYKATSSEFSDLAISNRFISNDFSRIKKNINRKEYTGYCQIGELLILKHKTNGRLFGLIGKGSCRYNYADTIADHQRFRRERGEIYDKYAADKIDFYSYNAQYLLEQYL